MASEKAKELAAKQKAEAKAIKAAKTDTAPIELMVNRLGLRRGPSLEPGLCLTSFSKRHRC